MKKQKADASPNSLLSVLYSMHVCVFVQGENRVFDQITVACKEHATIQSSKKTETELVFQLVPKTKSGSDSDKPSADQNQKLLKLDELKKMRSAQESSETILAPGDKFESIDHKK